MFKKNKQQTAVKFIHYSSSTMKFIPKSFYKNHWINFRTGFVAKKFTVSDWNNLLTMMLVTLKNIQRKIYLKPFMRSDLKLFLHHFEFMKLSYKIWAHQFTIDLQRFLDFLKNNFKIYYKLENFKFAIIMFESSQSWKLKFIHKETPKKCLQSSFSSNLISL